MSSGDGIENIVDHHYDVLYGLGHPFKQPWHPLFWITKTTFAKKKCVYFLYGSVLCEAAKFEAEQEISEEKLKILFCLFHNQLGCE